VGDVNIAHKEIDLKNWKSNQKNSGFTARRARLDDPAAGPKAAWWTCTACSSPTPPTPATHGGATAARPGQQRGLAAGLPPGHAGLAAKARREKIYLEQRFSDHAPLIIDYDFKLFAGRWNGSSTACVDPE
jgi:exodeoxyribonuclease-3